MMGKISNIKRFFIEHKWMFISYFTVLLIILGAYIIMGIYPFGKLTVIKIDLYNGYAPLMNEFRNAVLNGKNLTYSWQGGLGVSLLPNLFTDLLSPFSLLAFLFRPENITEMYAVMFLVEIPVSAATFCFFMKSRYQEENIWVFLFSVMYALCSFVTAYYTNVMWMDTVFILPIVAAGVYGFVTGKSKGGLYLFSLAYSIITSFYTAVFICIFSLCYFAIEMYLHADREKIGLIKKSVKFAVLSLLGGGISGFVIIPLLYVIPYTQYTNISDFPQQIQFYNSVLRWLIPNYFGVYPSVAAYAQNVPNIYSGIFAFALLPFFFINKRIHIKEKILAAICFIVLFLSFDVNVINYMIHGMHYSAWFPHRFSFIYSFFVLVLAYKAWKNFDIISLKAKFVVLFISLLVPIELYLVYPQKKLPRTGFFSIENLYQNIILILLYFSVFFLFKWIHRKTMKRIIAVVLPVLIIAEAGFSTYKNFIYKNDGVRDSYIIENYSQMKDTLKPISSEQAFYRTEYVHFRSATDPKLYGYNGYNIFAPFSYWHAWRFSALMGFNNSINRFSMGHPTPLINSIFSIKYLINRGKPMGDTFTLFNFFEQQGSLYTYSNPYVLPIGFMTDDAIDQTEALSNMYTGQDIFDTFALQNDFAKKAASMDQDLFTETERSGMDLEHCSVTGITSDNVINYKLDDDITTDVIPKATITFYAPEDKWTYLHVYANGVTGVQLYVDNTFVLDQVFPNQLMTLDAGYVKKGSRVRLVLNLNKKMADDDNDYIREGSFRVLMAQMDLDLYKETVAKLQESPLIVQHYDTANISGDITVKESGKLFTTIPYDEGWKVFVDGIQVQPNKTGMGSIFLQLDLAEGSHHIEFSYQAPGLFWGFLISLVSVIASVLLLRRRKE